MQCNHCDTTLPDGSRFCSGCGADLKDPTSGPRPRHSGQVTDLLSKVAKQVEGRYKVDGLIGRGGMGAVFKAVDMTLDRPVAIKVLPPEMSHDEKFVGRFEREARTAAKLDHPSIIPIYAVESSGGLHYFVMKFITGRSLDQVLDAGPVPIELAQRVVWQCATALGHAHQRGVIHRDIKPGNIMIDDEGRSVLTDFGISKALQAATQLTATGQVIGTPHYMSPEQAKGLNVDGRSDQYSLALVAYRMLTGDLPFQDESVHTVLYKQIFEEPPPLNEKRPDAPAFLVDAIRRGMTKNPDERFATMEEFATAVWPENPVAPTGGLHGSMAAVTGPSLADQPTEITSATPPTPSTPAPAASPKPAPRKKSRAVPAIAAVVVILGGAGAAFVMMQGGGGEAATPPVAVASQEPAAQPAAPPAQAPAAVPETVVVNVPAAPPPVTQPAVQPPARPQMGFITISATPFGRVSIDGVEIQDTPLVGYELSPGRHIISVSREGYESQVDTVTVSAGGTTRKSYVLIRQEQ